ncbi:hypothetical protein LWC34_47690 [Kibdelosporangium philippinense]|uniref:ORC1/DEAH AAA+ ATPase domain-containing protein n=1 Tax=Kibdelosporangium philippinense TaxID=211113 RepID=A0ABS8ZRU2_9PSEU|nr:AAA family ATPase [Kibdelosporangium philippinense]MCE7010439.1 hypothetical protein [Kibdelosporangium philippinense]
MSDLSDLTSFVGRQAEVDQAGRQLSVSRLVTLTGPGGAGKTRLATRLAQDYVDDARFIALDSLRDPGLLAQTVAAELGLRDVPDEPTSRVVEFLKDKSLLLVLDNCEHMVQACGTLVGKILDAAPDVRILATSRHVLGVGGEQLLPVNPLPVPQVRNGKLVGDSSAVTLFADRAAAAAPGFEVTEDNQETVVKICERLDGMPLAIELAVVWLRVLSLKELLARLDDRFRLLSRGEQTKPARHQTLGATVDWSYELCSPEEQALWSRLSVFDGGFTLAAAEAVTAFDSFEILSLIAGLLDKSVLIRDTAAMSRATGCWKPSGSTAWTGCAKPARRTSSVPATADTSSNSAARSPRNGSGTSNSSWSRKPAGNTRTCARPWISACPTATG